MARGWHGDKKRHSTAAVKGWQRRGAIVLPVIRGGVPLVHRLELDPETGEVREGAMTRELPGKTVFFEEERLKRKFMRLTR